MNFILIGQDDFPFWISGFLSSCGEGGLFCSNGKDPVVGDSDLVRIPAKILYRVAESIEGLFDVWTPVLLVEDKDLPKAVAEMVRFNCKTYPAPTPIEYFERSPYSYTKAQIERAYSIIQGRPEYQDVHAFHNSVGATYFFSEKEMHEKYARSLAEPELFTD